MKRAHGGEGFDERPAKLHRALTVDTLSQLSDELLLRILSYVPITTLNICQRLSHKFYAIAADSQLWKAAYYNRFVRPRASRIPGIKDVSTLPESLLYSSKLSKWLDEENLVRKGQETNWKRQYKLRHNWSRGKCAVSEIPVAEGPPVPPLLVRMHNGIIFTTDSTSGLRAWSSRHERELIASITLRVPGHDKYRHDQGDSPAVPGIQGHSAYSSYMNSRSSPHSPTSLAIDSHEQATKHQRVVVGFVDGSFSIYEFREKDKSFVPLYSHVPSSNGMLSALAYSSPYLLTMTEDQLLSLYTFANNNAQSESLLPAPRLLYSLRSHTVWPPLSLAIRTSSTSVTASIAYVLPTYLSGWTVGIQEMRLSLVGELIESRLATAADEHFHSLAGHPSMSSPSTRSSSPSPGRAREAVPSSTPVYTKPTSLSYSHPYLLVSHPDNTLTLYLVTSTASSLSVGAGSRLWGHTSSVSGAHVGGRGKAVSVSRQGDELRVWELEGGIASSATRRRLLTGELSVRVQPERAASKNLYALSEAISQRGTGLGLALEHRFDDLAITRGWVGFDEENVIVLQEKSYGGQALVVYDFT
ncbi:hypothetical protein K469DRAFT_730258 [Zopfia rhizophila CBS 207.26]|uniref:F-box domain-containing protein n=1 Tax=Zopfia rhizophila CBS 207.26 TaxID=1314779 RepID=A0A6A6DL91_9PEZI|nr:hypothetical protein K469DRAFT_730258 [Zopfia rhizophila CBS 207.26]